VTGGKGSEGAKNTPNAARLNTTTTGSAHNSLSGDEMNWKVSVPTIHGLGAETFSRKMTIVASTTKEGATFRCAFLARCLLYVSAYLSNKI